MRVELIPGGWNRIQEEGDMVQGGWNRIQVKGETGTRRVEYDPGRGRNWYQKGGTGSCKRVDVVLGGYVVLPGPRSVE